MASTRAKVALAVLLFVSVPLSVMLVSATWAKQAETHDGDSAAIKKLFGDFNSAFNDHDAHAAAILFTNDADFITVGGAPFQGSAAIEQHLAPLFSGRAKTIHREATLRGIRFLRADTATVDSDTETSGIMGPNGVANPPVKGLYDWIVTKQKGRWLIAVWHESNLTTPAGLPPAH